jgi:hypothetical protein
MMCESISGIQEAAYRLFRMLCFVGPHMLLCCARRFHQGQRSCSEAHAFSGLTHLAMCSCSFGVHMCHVSSSM